MKAEFIPYEVLIRYDNNGEVQGMHYVKTIKVTDDNGNIVSNAQGSPETVTLGIGQGLALEAVLGEINTANVKSIETLNSKKKSLETELKSVNNQLSETSNLLSETENKLNNANTEIEQLKAELEKSNQQLVEVNKENQELIKNIPVTDEK